MMRVLLAHAPYQQRGGEDSVFEAERELLRRNGHEVVEFRPNKTPLDLGALRLGLRTVWSPDSYSEIRRVIQHSRPDIAHFHNTVPMISPAGYYAARKEGVAVVQTLHNYRLICPGATLFREGKTCEKCVGKRVPWPALTHKCYRSSLAATGALTTMLSTHRALGTWSRAIDAYIALTSFARDRFIAGGLPATRIAIKPNFLVEDPTPTNTASPTILFVGRLSEEKGIRTLLDAVQHLPEHFDLRIVGDGPLAPMLDACAAQDSRVTMLGPCTQEQVYRHLRDAALLVCPSTNFEGFPMTIVEAFAHGVPVVASKLGSMSTLIQPGRNGAHFAPGDPESLATALINTMADPQLLRKLGAGARADYEHNYSAGRNHDLLTQIYELAIAARSQGRTIELSSELRGEASQATPEESATPKQDAPLEVATP